MARVLTRFASPTFRQRWLWRGSPWGTALSSEIIQRDASAPAETLQWYREELGVTLPQLHGPLLDLPLMQSRLEFYKQLGVSSVEFGELVTQSPHVLALEHTSTARANLQYLRTQGLSSFLLCNVVMHMPSILTLSLEAHLKPRMAFYREQLGLSGNEMMKLFEECPEFLQFSIVKDIRWRVAYFEAMGMTMEELTKEVILECPAVLGNRFYAEFQPSIQYLRTVCRTHTVKMVLCAFPHAMMLSLDDQLKPFVEYFAEELGMGRRLVNQLLENCPRVLASNLDREIRPKIEFLKRLELDQLQLFRIIVHRPHIFTKSLKEGVGKRIDEMQRMGVSNTLIRTLLVKSPNYFA